MEHLKEHIKTDEELLSLFYKDGNNYWLGCLLERYTLLMLGVCLKYLKNMEDAKDAVQQIFTNLITNLRKHKVLHFKAWLLIVTRNYCLMQYRKKNKKNTIELTDKLYIEDNLTIEVNKEEDLLKNITTEQIIDSLSSLNKEQRICIDLFYLQQKSYKDIINVSGFTFKQVKTYIQNGKRNLKAIIMQKIKSITRNNKNN